MEEKEQKEPQSWKEVSISPELSLVELVNLLNVFNQRIALLEDLTNMVDKDGNKKTVTQFIKEQTEEMKNKINEEKKGE